MGSVLQGVSSFFTPQDQYSALLPPIQQQSFGQAIQNSQNAFNTNTGSQASLAQALQAQANGAGPNPAAAQLQQATQQNVKNATGIVASQKGINPGMAARLAGQNAASANQTAAGQAATMRANQQLQAQGQLQNLYGTMGQQQLGMQQVLQSGQAAQNSAINSAYLGTNGINAQTAAINAGANQQTSSGLLGGLGAVGAMLLAKGGRVPGYDSGGIVDSSPNTGNMDLDNFLFGRSRGQASSGSTYADNTKSFISALGTGMDKGISALASALSAGGEVPGRAKVSGDDKKNDTVPAMLSPGEIVIPRSHAGSAKKAHEFVDALMKKEGKASESSYRDLMERKRKAA